MQWVLLHLYPFDNAMDPLTSISISQCNGPSYIWLYLSLFHGSHTHPVNKMFVFFITVKMFSSSSFFFCHHLQLNGLVGNIVKKVIDQKFSWMNYCKISLHQLPQCSRRDSVKALQHQKICPWIVGNGFHQKMGWGIIWNLHQTDFTKASGQKYFTINCAARSHWSKNI